MISKRWAAGAGSECSRGAGEAAGAEQAWREPRAAGEALRRRGAQTHTTAPAQVRAENAARGLPTPEFQDSQRRGGGFGSYVPWWSTGVDFIARALLLNFEQSCYLHAYLPG